MKTVEGGVMTDMPGSDVEGLLIWGMPWIAASSLLTRLWLPSAVFDGGELTGAVDEAGTHCAGVEITTIAGDT
jgi:hypothetical protein